MKQHRAFFTKSAPASRVMRALGENSTFNGQQVVKVEAQCRNVDCGNRRTKGFKLIWWTA